MTAKENWTVGDLLSTSSAYWRGCALQAGVRLGIFTALGGGSMALEEVAAEIKADLRGCQYLLDGLTAMGLLRKTEGQYSNSATAFEYLSEESPKYIGYIILHHHHLLDGWAQLHDAVTSGAPVEKRAYGEHDERESFLMGMFNLAMGIAPKIAAHIDLSKCHRLLDLGGGPGTYAIHFCLMNKDLSAVIYDHHTTEPFAMKTVDKFGLADRISFMGGDFHKDQIKGGPYDAAWLSQILHSYGPEECFTLIEKTIAAMKPGGQLMIHEFILDNEKASPEFPALFSLNMLINNENGRSYSEEELTNMMAKAGLKDIRRNSFRGPNDSAVMIGIV